VHADFVRELRDHLRFIGSVGLARAFGSEHKRADQLPAHGHRICKLSLQLRRKRLEAILI
jgi:hypothetical protein